MLFFIKHPTLKKACIGLEDDETTVANFIKQRVCHKCDLAIYIKKVSSYGKKKNYTKLKYFTMQKYNLQENQLKETKILQDIIITL